MTHDALRRLTEAQDTLKGAVSGLPGVAGLNVTFALDAIGRVTSASNGFSRSDYTYADPAGRLAGVHAETYNASAEGYEFDSAFVYDDNSNVTGVNITLPNLVNMNATFGYDALDRVHTVTGSAGVSPATFNYDAAGKLANVVLPNNITTTYAYDNADRLTGIADANPSLPNEGYAARTFTRNEVGAITGWSESAVSEGIGSAGSAGRVSPVAMTASFTYDIMDRLTFATYPQPLKVVLPTETYSYSADGLGHRTGSATGRVVDPASRLPVPVVYTVDPESDKLTDDSVTL